ncbi:MAG: cytochrome b [Stellaceae bacterium]
MSWKNGTAQYGMVAILIHWVSAVLILALFVLGFLAANIADPGTKAALLRVHVPLGLIILALTLARLFWFLIDRRPAPLAGMPAWQVGAERLVRRLLYLVILLMAASGIGMLALSGAGKILFLGAPGPLPDFWHYRPMAVHVAGAIALLALAGLHILAALHHHLVRRDQLLARMWTRPVAALHDR